MAEKFDIPYDKKIRVIIDSDVKNEVDDQFAIIHAVLTESFDLRGIIAAHFGNHKSPTSQKDSYKEAEFLLAAAGKQDCVKLYNGAEQAIIDEFTPQQSEGARLIIDEALKDDPRRLYIAFLGPLTDMASALLLCPKIAGRDITVIWIGGRDYPLGGWEYNLNNDIAAANAVFKSGVELWQVPRNVYRMMPVSFAELKQKVYPYGKIGKYLAENVYAFNNSQLSRPTEYRILGDSPAIGLMLYADCGEWEEVAAPVFGEDMKYIYNQTNRKIRVYKNINSRFILEDFYCKLQAEYPACK